MGGGAGGRRGEGEVRRQRTYTLLESTLSEKDKVRKLCTNVQWEFSQGEFFSNVVAE